MKNESANGNKALRGAVGICAKAGKLITGIPMICEAMKARKRIFLVIESSDNSNNSSKRLHDRCTYYAVPLHTVSLNGEELALAVGKGARIGAVAVTDENFYRLISKSLEETKEV